MAISENPLLRLPQELIDQILVLLDPPSLAAFSATGQRNHDNATQDRLWHAYLLKDLPFPPRSPAPLPSWRALYAALYPFWHLPANKIFFSNRPRDSWSQLANTLVLLRYEPSIAGISAFKLVAFNPSPLTRQWSYDPHVSIARFHPSVKLFLDDPVLELSPTLLSNKRFQHEIWIKVERDVGFQSQLQSRLFLARGVPLAEQSSASDLWPPLHFPGSSRAQTASALIFRDDRDKPSTYAEVSPSHFRIRSRISTRGFVSHLGNLEQVMTYATPSAESYTPTREKPWQGIWAGDYSGHGIEFVLVVQYGVEEASRLPEYGPKLERGEVTRALGISSAPQSLVPRPPWRRPEGLTTPEGCVGRLEALKLTGDPNVPNGERTWIAEDIGDHGLIRVADEEEFPGARIVKGWCHVASMNHENACFIPSQLIMISHDCVAQYVEDFGVISYFRRVDIDLLLNPEGPDVLNL